MNSIELQSVPDEVLSPFLPGTYIQYAWDSTCLGLIKTCPRLYQYRIIEGWAPKDESVHLRFGSEFHLAQQDYHAARARGESHKEAMEEAVAYAVARTEGWDVDLESKAGKYKNRESLIRTLVNYFDHYAQDKAKVLALQDGTPATELSFRFELDFGPEASATHGSLELDEDAAKLVALGADPGPSMVQPYILCGHLDKVVEFGGALFDTDYKTTKSTLSEYYFNQFEPNNQMTLYTFASKVILDSPVKGVMIDAVQILLEPPYNKFERRFTHRTPDQIDDWLNDLEVILAEAEAYATRGYWPMRDTSCGNYGGCEFREVCSKSPQARLNYLKKGFVQLPEDERWNPLKPR